MNKDGFNETVSTVGHFLERTSPTWMTGLGIGLLFTAIGLGVRATVKTQERLEALKKKKGAEKLTAKETVSAAWKDYIPTAVSAVGGAVLIIASDHASNTRNAALATAYTLSETALHTYRQKVAETIGEKKEQRIREEAQNEAAESRPEFKSPVIVTPMGSVRCFDALSGRPFTSDREAINKAVNEINRRLRDEIYISLNEYYDEIGLDRIPIGDCLGWNIDKGYLDAEFSATLMEDGTPCMVVDLNCVPDYKFQI